MDGPMGDLPEWIELKILRMLDFNSLLNARATCQRWNELLNRYIGENAILNIRMDKSHESKMFRRGKWNEQLIAPYEEIRIIPKPENAFLFGKAKSRFPSSLKHFTEVKKFTLFENGSFLHFIHRYMKLLSNVKYVQIRELPYNPKTHKRPKYTYFDHAFNRAVGHINSWTHAMDNISRIETLRIRLYDRLSTVLYMQLFAVRMTALINVELDFTKLNDIPLNRAQLLQINTSISELIEHCYITLKQLRLKWGIRVDTDLDYYRSEEDTEPFFEFLLSLRNPVWTKLRLNHLSLAFPVVNFGLNLCESTLFPFLDTQEQSLKRATFTRVLPNAGIDVFIARFPAPKLQKFEFIFCFNDQDTLHQPLAYIRGIEVLLSETPSIDLSRLTSNRGRRESVYRFFTNFKIVNGHGNLHFVKPEMSRIVDAFQNIRSLEILDTSPYGKTHAVVTCTDFNMIVKKLRRLASLKLSNASGLNDAGLTKIPKDKIRFMNQNGVYYLPNYTGAIVASAKELRYLDLRDLSTHVSDVSVYFAFQHIKKLEKISFHGNHSITSWGRELLNQKFRKNPFFDVIFRPNDADHVNFGNYILPSADFP